MNIFNITDTAATRITQLVGQEAEFCYMRIAIQGGGCSGFQYKFELEKQKKANDCCFEHKGAIVVIDDISLHLINNGTLDFIEDLGGSEFVVKNPNATAKCGCGTSFSV